jgi:hypothetical protein
MDGGNEVVMECLNAKQRIVEPVFITTNIPFAEGDFDTDFYDIPFPSLEFFVVTPERISSPSTLLQNPSDYMLLCPKIYVSHEFLGTEQTRLLLDYDKPLPTGGIEDPFSDFVDMIDSDSESILDEDYEI